MRLRLHLSSKTRNIVLLVVAVLVPISILAVMQYRSMVDLEDKTKIAVKENLHQTLKGVERKVEEQFQVLAKEALLPVSDLAELDSENALQMHFGSTASKHPEIERLFFISHCSCRPKEEHRAYFFNRDEFRSVDSVRLDGDAEVRKVREAHERAETIRSQNYTGFSVSDLFMWQDSCSGCSNKGQTYIFYTVHSREKREHMGLAGLTFNTTYTKQQFLPQTIDEVLRSPDVALANSNIALAIFDEAKNQIYANTTGNVEYEVRSPFGRPFTRWEMAIGFKETTIAALARRNFRTNLVLTVLVLSVLVFGMALIVRTSARELKLAQAKSDFVSNVSHELKTPLTMIRLFAEILSTGRVKNPEKATEYSQIIENESRRLTQLIDNILDFSRMEAGRKNYRPVATDVTELVDSVIKSYEYQLLNLNFELEVDLQRNLPSIMVDADAISQAVLNLLNNAVKYSDKIKKIGVRVYEVNQSIAIEISDSGIGIPRSEHEKIFEKFHRVGTALVHNTKGSGLGLSLVKHIVEAHRGHVQVESVPGEGSRFTLLLPLTDLAVANGKAQAGAGGYEVAESVNN